MQRNNGESNVGGCQTFSSHVNVVVASSQNIVNGPNFSLVTSEDKGSCLFVVDNKLSFC